MRSILHRNMLDNFGPKFQGPKVPSSPGRFVVYLMEVRPRPSVLVWTALLLGSSAHSQTLKDAPSTGGGRPRALTVARAPSARPAPPAPAVAPPRLRPFLVPLRDIPAPAPELESDATRLTRPAPGSARHATPPLAVPIPRQTAAYRRTFRRLMAHPEVTDRYDELILKYAELNGLDARLMKAIIGAESYFHPRARSPKGAMGLMQVMPATGRMLGTPSYELADPEANIRVGAAYLKVLFSAAERRWRLRGIAHSDAPLWVIERVIAAYNAGPRAFSRTAWPRQTRSYVRKVLLFYQTRVTDLRRPVQAERRAPEVSWAPAGCLLY